MNSFPNLLFVFADQLRWCDLGCAGNSQVKTPNLDALAIQGALFPLCFANSPVCGPSRGILLTGLYPQRNQVVANDLPLPEHIPTIGNHLKNAGYATGYIGKWHLDGVPRDKWTPPGARRHGFDFWRAFNCSHRYFDAPIFGDSPEKQVLEGYEPQRQTDLALEFIQTHNRPWSLFLSWGPPHDPYPEVPPEFRALYQADELELRPNVEPLKSPPAHDPASLANPRRILADYYAAISALDAQIGRLLAELEATGQAENTLVVFTSDHGDMLGSQGMLKKQQPFEESAHIPFLARWPKKIPAGIRPQILLSTVDFVPTLLGALGIESGADFDGADLSPALLGENQSGPESVFLMELVPTDEGVKQKIGAWRGLRTRRYTFARHQNGESWILFDNQADPFQQTNLVGQNAELEAEMGAILDQWLEKTGDESLSWDELIRKMDLVAAWNEREQLLNGENARIISGKREPNQSKNKSHSGYLPSAGHRTRR